MPSQPGALRTPLRPCDAVLVRCGLNPERHPRDFAVYQVARFIRLLVGIDYFLAPGPVPINNRVGQWDLNHLPQDWKSDRRRWDMLHAIRIAILFAAFVLQI